MILNHLGEFIALGTAICWTVTGLAFQQATRRAGSLAVNILRLLMALILYMGVSFFVRGMVLPLDASAHVWIWMSISGLVGFVFGDYFLFKSYEFISARISMLVMALSPPFAAVISYFALGETMTLKSLFAMMVTLSGIVLVVTEKKKLEDAEEGKKPGLQFSFPIKGLVFALLGTIGQATGLVLSKYGMEGYNVFGATQIRVIAGSIGFIFLITFVKRWSRVKSATRDAKTMRYMILGAIFGPFIGVYLSLLSVKYTSVGIASTIMSIIPVLIIPPAIWFYKERVTFKEIIGAIITVGGVVLFFI
jgi:drug/metabolite transporter (DMT)-like permease